MEENKVKNDVEKILFNLIRSTPILNTIAWVLSGAVVGYFLSKFI